MAAHQIGIRQADDQSHRIDDQRRGQGKHQRHRHHQHMVHHRHGDALQCIKPQRHQYGQRRFVRHQLRQRAQVDHAAQGQHAQHDGQRGHGQYRRIALPF